MTQAELAETVATGSQYKSFAKKLTRNKLHDDLLHEAALVILEYPAEKFKNIRNPEYFGFGLLKKMAASSTSPFHNTYNPKRFTKHDLYEPTEYDHEQDFKIEQAKKILSNEHFFDKSLIKTYICTGNYAKTATIHGCSTGFAYKYIQAATQRIRNKMKEVNILMLLEARTSAISYHRQLMPMQRIVKTHPNLFFHLLYGPTDEKGQKYEPSIEMIDPAEYSKYNLCFYSRQLSHDYDLTIKTIETHKKIGLPYIIDVDDYWELPTDHYWHKTYLKERTAENVIASISNAAHVITTTDDLASQIGIFNKNVTVIPNCINPDDQQFQKREIPSEKVRIGWIGGVFHKEDIKQIQPGLCQLYEHRLNGWIHGRGEVKRDFQVCLGGFNPNPEYIDIENIMTCNYFLRHKDPRYFKYLEQLVPYIDHYSYDKIYRRLWAREINTYGDLYNSIDVCLAPLSHNTFNECKSELKIIEAGWMGKAVIASDISPYKIIEHGVSGYRVKQFGEWGYYIKKLINEKQRRQDMAERLNEKINHLFKMDKHNETRAQIFAQFV